VDTGAVCCSRQSGSSSDWVAATNVHEGQLYEVDRMKRNFQHSQTASIWIGFFCFCLFGLFGCGAGSQSKLTYDMELANQGYEELVKQNYDKAEAFYEVALSVNPSNPYVLLNLGVIYQNTGRIEQAKKMYQRVIALNSNQKAVLSTTGNHLGKKLSDIAKMNLQSLEK
jgi:tetratricopeptide (TPR) repeat protein